MTMFASASLTRAERRARWRTGTGVVLSVLIHAAVFFLLTWAAKQQIESSTSPANHAPLEITLTAPTPRAPPPAPKAPEAPKPPTPVKQPTPPKPRAAARPKSQPVTPRRPMLADQRPQSKFELPGKPDVAPSTPPRQYAPPEMDMSTMVNAARERRQAAESAAAEENAAARAAEAGPSANDIARANINFQRRKALGGTNGVFQIMRKGPRTATYQFRGWTNDRHDSQLQNIDVDAGPGGNIELAIVDSMINLIRKHYKGDFNWDSRKLGRVVVLSARPADTSGLQDFLLKEFFD